MMTAQQRITSTDPGDVEIIEQLSTRLEKLELEVICTCYSMNLFGVTQKQRFLQPVNNNVYGL